MALYTDYTDEQLVALLKNSDEGAFTEIHTRYWKRLFAVGAGKLGDLALAEELVQDILVDIWVRRERLQITGSLRTYLSVALKYKVIDARIKRTRVKLHEKNAGLRAGIADHTTEQSIHFEELKDRLGSLVRDLPEKCRLVYQLHKEDGYSYQEIAGQLDISEKTVEYHLSRAMKALRSGLSHFFSFFF